MSLVYRSMQPGASSDTVVSLGLPLSPEYHIQLFSPLLRKGFKGNLWDLRGTRYLSHFSDIY